MSLHHSSSLDGGHRAGEDHHHGVSRRTAVGAAGGGAVALLFAGIKGSPAGSVLDKLGPDVAEAAAGTCTMTPAKTVGPYFVEEGLNRSDVRADSKTGVAQAGLPLTLKLQVFSADADCAPVSGATVDIWHANWQGKYSDESSEGTSGVDWLRGYQTTDADGLVTFTTTYPGWYSGRAVHIHFKVRTYNGATEVLEFTSQLFFTDALNAQVYTSTAPYSTRSPQTPNTTDSADGIYGSDGASLLLSPQSDGNGGLTATFSVGVSQSTSQLGNTSAGAGGGMGGTPPTGGPGAGSGTGTTGSTGLSPVSPTTTTVTGDTTVGCAVKAATMLRTALGARRLKVKLKATEPVTVTARLTRGGKTLATRKTTISAGTRTVAVPIGASIKRGAASLRITVADASGNTKSYARTVTVRSLAR